jgi:hypothetical protein
MPNQTTDPNSTALDAVAKLLDNLDPIIGRFDDLNQQKAKLEADLKESEEVERKTLDDESLSHDAATTSLIAARTKSDVLRVRLQSIEQKISDQLKAVIAAGQLAQSAGYAVWHQLHQHRIRTAHDLFNKHFRLPWGAPISVSAMMEDATLPKEVVPLKTPFEFDHTHPVEFNLGRLRTLRQAFTELRTAVEAEPGLVLQSPASAPEVSVVAA